MDVMKETERLKQHQILYKAKTPPWKDAFREKCIQRLRSNRSRLVDRFRGLTLGAEVIDVVMKEEWKSFTDTQIGLSKSFDIDTLNTDDAEVNYYSSIFEEIQKELIEEEKRILEEYYAAEIEAQSINSTIDWLERDEVICPLCKKQPLYQNVSVIFCGCGFRIDTQQDGFTLHNFKEQLHEGLEVHEKTCCSEPSFSHLQYCSFTNLAITCELPTSTIFRTMYSFTDDCMDDLKSYEFLQKKTAKEKKFIAW